MNKRSFSIFLVIFSLTLISLPGPLTAEEIPQAQLEKLVEKGDEAAEKARFKNRTEAQLRKAIDFYKKVLEDDPNNTHSLNRLSSGFYLLAEAYLGYEKRKEAYQKGFDYGVRSLRTNPDFRRLHNEKGFSALEELPESVNNVEGLVWTAGNLSMLAHSEGVLDSLGKLPALVSLNRRAIELDNGYLGAAAHNALACISAVVLDSMPFTFWQTYNHDFSWKKTKEHFEKAIELAPDYLGHYFSYAHYYALNKDKEELAKNLLKKVIQEPLGDTYPLMNKIAKDKAETLINRL